MNTKKYINGYYSLIKTLLFSSFVVVLASCTEPKNEEELANAKAAAVAQNTKQLDASSLNLIRNTPSIQVAGSSIGISDVIESGTLNSTGSFSHPDTATEFDGNISVSLQAFDDEGISRVFLAFAQSDYELNICEQECGTEFAAFVNGINPLLFDLTSGEHNIQLWIEDNDGNIDMVDTVNINWRSLVISGVSVSFDQENEQINVTWNPLDGMLRYNLYIANDNTLNGKNVEELEGGEARLALTETSASFSDKVFQQNYWVLVTGVDGSGESAFSALINLLNDPKDITPIAVEDNFTTDEDTSITGNLLDNDIGSGDVISLVIEPINGPTQGTVVFESNGSFTYTPFSNRNGVDQFSYQIVNSNGLTSDSLVTINITPVNDAPVALDNNYTIEADSELLSIEAPGLLDNDSDIDGDTLSVNITPVTEPEYGELTLNSDGSFEYTANELFIDSDEFVYQVSDDSGLQNTAKVIITLPDFNGYTPRLGNDSYQTPEDALLVIDAQNGILANDSDKDHDISQLILTIEETTNNGTLNLSDDGSFTYSPDPNFDNIDSFTYQLQDPDGNTNSATVTISVSPQNDAPTANNDTYLVPSDAPITINTELGLLKNDSDIDQDEIKVEILDIGQPTSDIGSTVVVNEDGSFTYTPGAGRFVGTNSFTYTVTDGSLSSATATVTLYVVEISAITDDQTQIELNLLEGLSELENFSMDQVSFSVDSGSVELDNFTIIYTPEMGFVGIDVINITITTEDGDLTIAFNVQVERYNTAALAAEDTYLVKAEQPTNIIKEFGLLINDMDAEGDSLSITIDETSTPESGTVDIASDGSFTYTPNDGFIGTDSFTYTLSDGFINTAPTTVTIEVVEELVYITDIDTIIIPISTFTNAGHELYALQDVTVSKGSIDENLLYTPELGSEELVQINFLYEQGHSFTFDLKVSSTLDQLLPQGDSYQVEANTTTNFPASLGLLMNDIDDLPETLSVLDDQTSTSINGNLVINPDGSFSYTPINDFVGLDTYTYTVNDGSYTKTAEVIFNVTKPLASLVKNTQIEINLDTIANNFTDFYEISDVASDSNAVVEINGSLLTYSPVTDFVGIEQISVTVITNSESNETVELTFDINVLVSDTLALGNHDINNDMVDDIFINYLPDELTWQISTSTGVAEFIKIDSDGRLYPYDANSDGVTQVEYVNLTADLQFAVIINNIFYTFDLIDLDLNENALIDLNKVGSSLTTDTNTLLAGKTFVDIYPAWNGFAATKNASMSPRYLTGATYQFNSDGTGLHTSTEQPENFTWVTSGSSITVTKSSPEINNHTYTLDNLLELELIDQAEFEYHLNNGGYNQDQFELTSTQPIVEVTVDKNQFSYLQVTEISDTIYHLPATLVDTDIIIGNGDISVSGEPSSYRLYDLATISSYPLDTMVEQYKWALPVFDIVDGVVEGYKHVEARFDSNNSGEFTNLDTDEVTAFTWSVSANNTLNITYDYYSYSYQKFGQFNELAGYVLMTLVDSYNNETYTSTRYLSPVQSPSLDDILADNGDLLYIGVNNFMQKGLLQSFVSVNEPTSYNKDGKFNTSELFAFELFNEQAIGATEGFKEAQRLYGYYIDDTETATDISVSKWTWSQDANKFSLVRYMDLNLGQNVYCEPTVNQDNTCFEYMRRDLEVISLDYENDLVWVLESQQVLESSPNVGETASYVKQFGPRVNAFKLIPQNALTPYIHTAPEDASEFSLDPFYLALNSQGGTGQMEVIGAIADNGTVRFEPDMIYFTPPFDFNGEVTITYTVKDEFGAISTSTITIVVTSVNDAPVITSQAPTLIPEGDNYYYPVSVTDSDDDNNGTDLIWSLTGEPSGMTISATGVINWLVPNGVTSSGTVTITVSDGELAGTETFEVTVTSDPLLTSITYQDEVIKSCLLSQYDSSARASDVTYINCDEVETLVDLIQFPNLRSFNIPNVTDWSDLSYLNIEDFTSYGTSSLTDWSLLLGHTNLTSMTLYGANYIVDQAVDEWDFLDDFNLGYLNLDVSNFSNLSHVTHMTNLKALLVSDTSIAAGEWSKLSALQLDHFHAGDSTFSNISDIQHMTGLNVLNLDITTVNDWSNLSTLNLIQFSANNSNFSDLNDIQHMDRLEFLHLNNTSVDNWAALVNFDLNHLDVNANVYFDDLSLLTNSIDIYRLDIGGTAVTNFEYLSTRQFDYLNLADTSFGDISVLNNSISVLTELNINNTFITDISSLLEFSKLNTLYADLPNAEDQSSLNQQLIALHSSDVYIVEAADLNTNGVFDFQEVDTDADGYPDYVDAFPNDYSEYYDSDGDGVGDNADIFSSDPTEWLDTDQDGVGDNSDPFPSDPSEWLDTDEDGIGNNSDPDDDNDGTIDINDDYPLDETRQTAADLSAEVDFVENDDGFILQIYTFGPPNNDAEWFAQSEYLTTGSTALRSGSIADSQESILTAEIDTGQIGATLTFDWKVSSESGYDFLEVYLNGDEWYDSISGEIDWETNGVYIPPGVHTVKWVYKKDGSASSGKDAGWIDNVQLTAGSPP